ncbi:hypothetical protein RMATCC62417_04860 [Rhizopus microsporus]|nr:hypothetical protein RMATCC62417_04860 [Rhizopus microsporus]
MSSVFFYGSLMSPVVLIRVLLGSGVSEQAKLEKFKSIRLRPASLKGYIRSSLKGEDYPAIVHTGKEQDKVAGILCEGLSKLDVRALDTFEGEDYLRSPVRVTVDEDQTTVETDVYHYVGDSTLLTYAEWTLAEFISTGKEGKWLEDRVMFYQVDLVHLNP